jgi:two-component system, chemotaxis family, response regulator Rcp1
LTEHEDRDILLLIEDNPADIDLTRDSFAEANSELSIEVATDGVEAMSYLNQEHQFQDAVRPRLILLDLNLPRLDGREVLREVKANKRLRQIPVIVWSSSHAGKDISDCYDLGANCYLVKPLDLRAYQDMIRTVERFWMEFACLPQNPTPLAPHD